MAEKGAALRGGVTSSADPSAEVPQAAAVSAAAENASPRQTLMRAALVEMLVRQGPDVLRPQQYKELQAVLGESRGCLEREVGALLQTLRQQQPFFMQRPSAAMPILLPLAPKPEATPDPASPLQLPPTALTNGGNATVVTVAGSSHHLVFSQPPPTPQHHLPLPSTPLPSPKSPPRAHRQAQSKWTPEQVSELQRLLGTPEAASTAASSESFWESLSRGSPLLQSFSTEALRQKAKRLKLRRLSPEQASPARMKLDSESTAPAAATGKRKRGVRCAWSEEQLAELAELVSAQRGRGSRPLHQYFWRDLPLVSRTLRGFSKEALRMKARRLRLIREGDEVEAAASGAQASASWSKRQDRELMELLAGRQGAGLGPEQPGFWANLRAVSKSLQELSDEEVAARAAFLRGLGPSGASAGSAELDRCDGRAPAAASAHH